jgi:mono/diheme cytochrome c family protein
MRRIAILSMLLASCAVSVGGCGVSMTEQKRYRTYAPSAFWPDGASARPLPENSVAQSDVARAHATAQPPDVSEALLARGHERYEIFCSPCHGLDGYGDGMIVQRGFPKPPSYHSDRLRSAPAQHFFDVISNGYGVMYSYAARIPPADRWAIIAYVRALQLSQQTRLADVPDAREKLQ